MPCDGAGVRAWFAELLRGEGFALAHMPLADSPSWTLREGAIRHRSGRFFAVVGVAAVHSDGRVVGQPMLDQREIGTLAFILRQRDGRAELLVQAKVEPGNVGTVQLAPSFQATASNAARAHGGDWPPLHEWFDVPGRGTLLADELHSEQGARFHGKRNRNCTLRIAGDAVHGRYHRWRPRGRSRRPADPSACATSRCGRAAGRWPHGISPSSRARAGARWCCRSGAGARSCISVPRGR
jgi:oxidase EvaA